MAVQVISGGEPYIIDKKVSAIKKGVMFPEMNLLSISELNEEVKSIINTLPVVEDKRVVILSQNEIKGDELLDLIKDVPSTTDVIIVIKNIDKRSSFYKFIKKNNLLIECNKLTEQQLRRFVYELLKENRCNITNSAYMLMVNRMNYFEDTDVSLYTVETFVRQLMFLSSVITDKEVQRVVPESSNEKIFVLTKASLTGNQEKAFSMALDFVDRGENVIGMLSMMLRVFRLAYKASLFNDLQKSELGALLGVPLFQFQDALTVPETTLNLILDIIQDAINGIKTGKCEARDMFLIVIGKITSVLNPSEISSNTGRQAYL